MTPLFPEDGEHLAMKQGDTGDCYLIASIDCIYNSSKEGRERFKSMFHMLQNGDVEVWIKRTPQSANLKPEMVGINYTHRIEQVTRDEAYDVITVGKNYLAIIDQSKEGVDSNSLAVKIIERLSSYYYASNWKYKPNVETSISAHNQSGRHTTTSTRFVAALLDLHAHDMELIDKDKIIALKARWPDAPVYISLDYGQMNAQGHYHGRHGLRLDRIIPNDSIPGKFDYVLVNPWNNLGTETVNDIERRKTRFCLFSKDKASNKLTWLIVNNTTVEDGQYIFANEDLKRGLSTLQQQHIELNARLLENIVRLHKKSPALFANLPQLLANPSQRNAILMCLRSPSADVFDDRYQKMKQNYPVIREKENVTPAAVPARGANNPIPRKPGFEEALELAIREKAKQPGFADTARKTVEQGLVTYYFQGKFINLTAAGGLRSKFTQGEFTEKTIAASRVNNKLLPGGLFLAMSGNASGLTSHGKNLLQGDYTVSRELYQQTISQYQNSNTDELLAGLYNLSLINASTAEKFLKYAKEDLLAGRDLNEIVARQEAGPAKVWLAKQLLHSMPQPNPGVRRVAEFKATLSSFTIKLDPFEKDKYEDCLAALDRFAADFKREYTQELNPSSLAQINGLVGEKKQALKKSVQPYLLAEAMLETAAEEINYINTKFFTHKVLRTIRPDKELRKANANNILNDPTVIQAERFLGYEPGESPIIKGAKQAFFEKIDAESSKQVQYLKRRAQNLVAPKIAAIHAFHYNFAGCTDLVQVQKREKAIQGQIDILVEHDAASREAANIEGALGFSRPLSKAYHEKLKEIRASARAAENNIKNESSRVIDRIITRLRNFPINFTGCKSEKEIEARREELEKQLQTIIQTPAYRNAVANGASNVQQVNNILSNQQRAIEQKSVAAIVSIRKAAAPQILASIDLKKYMDNLEDKVKRMEKDALTKPDYKIPSKKARQMYNSLEHNRRKFLEGELSVQGFKLACKTAVDIAMPDLKIHRGCKEAVYKVLNRVISIATFGISAAITYGLTGRYNMFTPKTESEGKALDVDKAIQNIKPR